MKLKPSDIPSQANKTIFINYNGKAVKDRGFTNKETLEAWIVGGVASGKITWTEKNEEGWHFRILGCSFDCTAIDRKGNPIQ